METITLIYNKKLLDGPPPTELSELVSLNQTIKKQSPGVLTILWDYTSPYYSWGILASAGGYVFGNKGTDYDLKNVGVATGGAVENHRFDRCRRPAKERLFRCGGRPNGPRQACHDILRAMGMVEPD